MELERNIKKKNIRKQKQEILSDNDTIKKKTICKENEISVERDLTSINNLSEIERDVLNLAEEIFKLRKYNSKFNIETKRDLERYPIIGQLYSNCISKFHYSKGYSKEELFTTIRILEKKGWIVSEGRRTKLEILKDDKYKNLIELIRRNPGIYALDQKVEEELGITRTPFIKRILVLLRYKIIRIRKIGKIVHYFLEKTPSSFDELKALFLNPLVPRIISEILKDKTISRIQLSNKLNEPVHKIHYYLIKIKNLEVVKDIRDNNGKKVLWINKDLLSDYNKVFKDPSFIIPK
jgi:hypothetical protein